METQLTASSSGGSSTRCEPAWSSYRKVRVIGVGGYAEAVLVEPIAPSALSLLLLSNSSSSWHRQRSAGGGGESRDDQGGGDWGTQNYDSVIIAPPPYAVIKRSFLNPENPDAMVAIATEVKVLQSIPPHRNIVRYFDHFMDSEGYLNIVQEYCDVGDLERYVQRRNAAKRPLTVAEVVHLSFEILCGVRYLHRQGIMHRDVKPANILLVDTAATVPDAAQQRAGDHAASSAGGNVSTTSVAMGVPLQSSTLALRLADFGIARVMGAGSVVARTVVGTPHYISPELCESRPYTYAADMWAVGCVIWEMCQQGEKLFGGDNMMAVVCRIAAANVPRLDPPFDILQELVDGLVRRNAEERLTASDALERFFFRGSVA